MTKYIKRLKQYRHLLTKNQISTIRGQILAGDVDGAMRGLNKIIEKGAKKQ